MLQSSPEKSSQLCAFLNKIQNIDSYYIPVLEVFNSIKLKSKQVSQHGLNISRKVTALNSERPHKEHLCYVW